MRIRAEERGKRIGLSRWRVAG